MYFLILVFISALSREPDSKIREKYEDQGTGKERDGIEKSYVSNQAGPSSQITDRLKKKAKHMERGEFSHKIRYNLKNKNSYWHEEPSTSLELFHSTKCSLYKKKKGSLE